jgi:hypothetical protein
LVRIVLLHTSFSKLACAATLALWFGLFEEERGGWVGVGEKTPDGVGVGGDGARARARDFRRRGTGGGLLDHGQRLPDDAARVVAVGRP